MPKQPLSFRFGFLTTSLVLTSLLGCTSGENNQGFTLSPSSPQVEVGEQLSITAHPMEDVSQEPEWEIQELHGGGFLNSQGLHVTYVAPPSAGRYHLILRSTRPDGTKIKTVEEIVVVPSPQVEPSNTHVSPGGTATFTVKIKGLPKNTVVWSVQESEGGSINADGLYTAPARAGVYHVVATSTLDKDVSATATVRVD